MRNIRDLKVTQLRLFGVDEIPLRVASGSTANDLIVSAFKSSRVTLPVGLQVGLFPPLIYARGEVTVGGKPVFVDQLIIEERRIIITASAESGTCNVVFDKLVEILKTIDSRKPLPEYKPIVMTEETAGVVQLDIPIFRLFEGTKLDAFFRAAYKKVEAHGSDKRIFPLSVKFRVAFDNIPEVLNKNRVTLSDKEIVVELRERTSVADQTFFISSPTSSDAFLEIIGELEKEFAK